MPANRKFEVKALSRVEGEGALYVKLEGGQVDWVELNIYEPPASSRPSSAAARSARCPISPPGSAASARSPTR